MKKILSVLIVLALALAFSIMFTAPVAADPGTTFYVSNTGSDETGTGAWDNPWATIQHAVAQVSSGHTIQVASGTYTGAIVDKDVTILGSTSGTSSIDTGVCYNSGCSPAYKTAFRLDAGADGAEIGDFTINCDVNTSFYFAIFARAVDDVTIDSLEITDTVQGISNWGGSGWEITNNTITDTVAAGGGGIGILVGAQEATSGWGTCRDNLVQYNTIDASASAEDYSCPAILLTYDLRWGGYLNVDGSEDISGNLILDNTITASAANNLVGIEVGTILGDSETDPIRNDPDEIAAVMAAAALHDNTVQDNSVDGADIGIYFYNATNLTITENTVQNNVGYGMYAEHGQNSTVITDNTFTNNDVQLMDDTDDTETLDSLDIESILAGNTFDRAVVVRGSGIKVPAIFSSIQDAIDAAVSGDTVDVAAGTYEEFVHIDKPLSLRGPFYGTLGYDVSRSGSGEAVIRPPSDAERVQPDVSVYLVRISSGNVTISGFTVTDEEDTNGEFAATVGIHSKEGGLECLNNRIISMPKFGISVARPAKETDDWFDKTVAGNGTIVDVLIEGNLVTETALVDDKPTWGYGIQLSGTVADVIDNQVVDSRVALAIQPYNQPSVELDVDGLVQGNRFESYRLGLFFHAGGISGHYAVSGNWLFDDNTFALAEIHPDEGVIEYWAAHTRASKFYFGKSIEYRNNAFNTSNQEDFSATWSEVRGLTFRNDLGSHTSEDLNFVYSGNMFTGSGGEIYVQLTDAEKPSNPPLEIDLEMVLADNSFDRAVVVRGSGIKVPIIFSSIQDAVDAASTGDTIEVAAGTYTYATEGSPAPSGLIKVTKALTIKAADGVRPVIDGTGFDGVFKIHPAALNPGDTVIIEGFDIAGDSVTDIAITMQGCFDVTPATVIIRDNYFHGMNGGIDFWGAGAYLPPGWTSAIAGVQITDNKFYDLGDEGSAQGFGVMLEDPANWETAGNAYAALVEGNQFYDIYNGSSDPGVGIVIPRANDTYEAANAYIAGNNFSSVSIGVAITDGGVEDARIINSSFDCSVYGVYVVSVDNGPVDATANWWGDASGPYNATTNPSGTGDSVSDNVDYSPWWGANYMDVAHPWTWYTNDRIQEAIDAASAGDTVNVLGGTYDEQVVIDKSLTLVGAGKGQTFVKAAGSPVITVSADNVTIQDLEVTDDPYLVEGIRLVSGASTGLTVDRVAFTELGAGTGANAYGIYIANSFANLSVTDCDFAAVAHDTNYRTIGIFAPNNLQLDAFEVTDSTFEKIWTGIYLRSAIDGLDVMGSTFGPVQSSDFAACVSGIYIGDGSDYNFDVENVVVSGNTFIEYGRGVYVWNYANNGTVSNFEIYGNNFTNSVWSSGVRFIAGLGEDEGVSFDGISVHDNLFTQNSTVGTHVALMDFRAYCELAYCDIDVIDNEVTLSGGPYTDPWSGIVFLAYDGPFTNTLVDGNVLNGGNCGGAGTPPSTGILVKHESSTYWPSGLLEMDITHNEITGFDHGVGIYDNVAAEYGGLPTGSDVDINYNKIHGNGLYGVINGNSELVDATYNWWGFASGPYHVPLNLGGEGNAVSDNVLFDPWYGDEGMTTLVGHSTYKFSYELPDVIVAREETVVPVTFETDVLAQVGYDGIRFKFSATGPGNAIFKATDSTNTTYTFANWGYWGPPTGFNLTADYSATTDWSLNFSEPGEYEILFSLVNADTDEVVAGIEGSQEITVRAEDIFEYYRMLHGADDEVDTLDLLAAADDWSQGVTPTGFDGPITTLQLLALADEWYSAG
jgi:parallel beta-helix repeat protein